MHARNRTWPLGSDPAERCRQRTMPVEGGDGSTLSLDFTTGVLDPRLTFTRASGGTYVANDGYIYGMDFATSSSLAIGTGSKSVTLTATAGVDRRYLVGQTVWISNGANNMRGPVTAYSASTQVLTINATATSGSGSFTSWTVGNASARFDHDPTTGAPRGLLIEGAATNLFLNSSLDSSGTTTPANWSRGFSQSTVASVNSTVFPGMKAWSISATASGQRDWLTPTVAISVAANTTYTVSVYVESRTGTLGPSGLFAYFETIPAGATSTGISNPVVGRNTCTLTVGATAGTATFRIGIGTSGGTDVASNAQVTFSHLQIEAGSSASSYIPTGASTGNRTADNCSIVSPNFSTWYNQGEGTFLLHCQLNRIGAQHLLNVNVNNAAPRLMITEASSQFNAAAENPSGTNFNLVLGSSSTNAAKVIAAFKNLDVAGTRNGATVQTSTAMTVPTTVNLLRIGSAEGGYQYMTGTVSLLKYWPTRLPNAQLQSLTT